MAGSSRSVAVIHGDLRRGRLGISGISRRRASSSRPATRPFHHRPGRARPPGASTNRPLLREASERASARVLAAAVLAGVRARTRRCSARVRRPGVRAGHGVGAGRRERAGRARRRPGRAAGRPTSCCCARRSVRSTSWPRRCAGTIRSRRACAPRSTATPTSPRWRRRSTTCSTGWSPSGATARARRCWCRRRERQRIARELHDEVGQTLTGVMLQVEGLAASIPDELRDAARRAARDRPPRHRGGPPDRAPAAPRGAEELGLQSALAALATAFERAGADPGRAPAGARRCRSRRSRSSSIYRVAQEALTNVARHAEATRVELELRARDGQRSS